MADEYKEFLSIEEVAEYLGVYRDTVYRYIKDVKKPLPAMRISRKKILVKKVDLEKWLEETKVRNGWKRLK
jgi:excisionase family DNA binding protein